MAPTPGVAGVSLWACDNHTKHMNLNAVCHNHTRNCCVDVTNVLQHKKDSLKLTITQSTSHRCIQENLRPIALQLHKYEYLKI